MRLLLTLKPLFNSEMTTEGYYFSYQYGNAIIEGAKSNPLDGAMRSPFLEFVNNIGAEALSQSMTVFIPVTQILMYTDLERECSIEPGKVVFLLDKNYDLTDELLERVKRFSKLGFKIAFRQPPDAAAIKPFLPFTDYIFIKMPQDNPPAALRTLRSQYPGIKLVVTDIENKVLFDGIKHLSAELFDGPFYKVHIPTAAMQNALSPLKVNYVQLLNVANQDDFDLQDFTRVIRQDTALAIQFMQLCNSANRSGNKLTNINQAAALLGQREIKKWISTAVSNALCADRPSEITRLSLIRAKFCENMARHFEMAIMQDNLFLTGLLSVLDVILEMPIEDAMKMVFVPDAIKMALVDGSGEYYSVLNFVLHYEQGDWLEISRLSVVMNISIDDINTAFVSAMKWYSDLINMPVAEIET